MLQIASSIQEALTSSFKKKKALTVWSQCKPNFNMVQADLKDETLQMAAQLLVSESTPTVIYERTDRIKTAYR